MVNKIKENIETETRTNICAIIQPIGRPIINAVWKCERRKKFLESANSFDKKSQTELNNIKLMFEMRCNAAGVIPVAKITENGANIFYRLTDDKIKTESGGIK
jgi:hypothetical protein